MSSASSPSVAESETTRAAPPTTWSRSTSLPLRAFASTTPTTWYCGCNPGRRRRGRPSRSPTPAAHSPAGIRRKNPDLLHWIQCRRGPSAATGSLAKIGAGIVSSFSRDLVSPVHQPLRAPVTRDPVTGSGRFGFDLTSDTLVDSAMPIGGEREGRFGLPAKQRRLPLEQSTRPRVAAHTHVRSSPPPSPQSSIHKDLQGIFDIAAAAKPADRQPNWRVFAVV